MTDGIPIWNPLYRGHTQIDITESSDSIKHINIAVYVLDHRNVQMSDETHLVVSGHYCLVKTIQARRRSSQKPYIGPSQSIYVLLASKW